MTVLSRLQFYGFRIISIRVLYISIRLPGHQVHRAQLSWKLLRTHMLSVIKSPNEKI